jgi:serine/threonine protein kinase
LTVNLEKPFGRYRLVSLLGEGGMGQVWKAHDPALERHVAIKILPPELIADASRVSRFIQEARAASALNHPHVVAVYDIGEETFDGEAAPVRYIAMELVDGRTLREMLDAGNLELRKGLKIVTQVAEALAAAHASGIVHRDLKPENIMVTNAGYAKVLDFGLAKLRGREVTAGEDTRTIAKDTEPGTVMGTVGYMSPEQAQGRATDSRSDIFSLGCVLYEVAAGKRAFRGDSSVDTLHKIIHNDPEPLRTIRPDAPPDLVRILRKMLAKDPDERYQSAKDLAIDLRDLLRDLDTNPSSPAATAPVAVIPQRSRWLPAALAGVAILAVVVAFFVLRRSKPQPASSAEPATGSMRITRVTASGKVIASVISPDGRYVAFVTSDQGEQRLVMRQMATGQTLELMPSIRRGSFWGLTFSNDGQSVYYGLKGPDEPSGAIHQVSTLGGTPRKIIENIDSQPSFSADGKRMAFLRARFPTAEESALMVANPDGSDAKALATIRLPERFVPVFFAGASWSPDGTMIATGVTNGDAVKGRVVAIDVRTGTIRTLAENNWNFVGQVGWMPDQKGLAFIAGNPREQRSQVWYLPYPSGEPYPLTNDLFDYRQISITSDGKSLMTVASDAAADIWLYPDNGSPKRITAAKLEGAFGVEALADGRILFTSLDTGKNDIWVMNADGSGRTLLTRDPNENLWPVPSPRGDFIVYTSVTPKGYEICRMNMDGSGRRVLTTTAVRGTRLDISPDGRSVVFEDEKTVGILSRVSVEGGKSEPLTSMLSFFPRYSPDGSMIAAYMQDHAGSPFLLAAFPASGGAPLKTIDFVPSFAKSAIRWTSDQKALIVNTAPSDRGNLWLVPFDGSAPRKLTGFDEHSIMAFAPMVGNKGWIISRGDLSRDAVLITGFRR